MEITQATKEDINAILALQTQIYRIEKIADGAKDSLKSQLKDLTCNILIAKVENKIIGTATIHFIEVAARAQPYAFLEGLVIDEKERGKGFGTTLFKKCIEVARTKNCYKMLFTSGMDRERAHKFYENLGFIKWGYEFRMDL